MPKLISKEWRKSRKYFFDNKIHFIFFTKRRGNVLGKEILTKLEDIFRKNCQQMKCQLIEFEGKNDYVHLLVSVNPTVAISILAGKLKGTSSRLLVKEFSNELKEHLIDNHFWSSSYAAISHGDSHLEKIKNFFDNDIVPD